MPFMVGSKVKLYEGSQEVIRGWFLTQEQFDSNVVNSSMLDSGIVINNFASPYTLVKTLNGGVAIVKTSQGSYFAVKEKYLEFVSNPNPIYVEVISGGSLQKVIVSSVTTRFDSYCVPLAYRTIEKWSTHDNYNTFDNKRGQIIYQPKSFSACLVLFDDGTLAISKVRNLRIIDKKDKAVSDLYSENTKVKVKIDETSYIKGTVVNTSNGFIGVDYGTPYEGNNSDDACLSTSTCMWHTASQISVDEEYIAERLDVFRDIVDSDIIYESQIANNPFKPGFAVKVPSKLRGAYISDNTVFMNLTRKANTEEYVNHLYVNEVVCVAGIVKNLYKISQNPIFDENAPYEYFFSSDLSAYYYLIDDPTVDTNNIVGNYEVGKRLKCSITGKSHEAKVLTTVIYEDDYTLEGKDDDGWYVHYSKRPYRKPNGTRIYTQYTAICPKKVDEYHNAIVRYNAEMETRNNLSSVIDDFFTIREQLLTSHTVVDRTIRERIVRERRECEERERIETERRLAQNGIWCHHFRKQTLS
jgi:hypothetical protein